MTVDLTIGGIHYLKKSDGRKFFKRNKNKNKLKVSKSILSRTTMKETQIGQTQRLLYLKRKRSNSLEDGEKEVYKKLMCKKKERKNLRTYDYRVYNPENNTVLKNFETKTTKVTSKRHNKSNLYKKTRQKFKCLRR